MKTILIVDDAVETSDVLSLILKMDGYRVHCAMDGAEGLRMIHDVKPDLVMLDFMMPYMNGASMGQMLRSDASLAGTKILMHSCLPESALTGHFGEYDAFLRKPYDVDVALRLIQNLIEGRPDERSSSAECRP